MIVLGAVLGVVGVLQKTVWAPPENITATTQTDESSAAAVIEPGVLNLYPGGAQVTVKGTGDITVAHASKPNVEAWLGEASYLDITGLKTQEELRTEKVAGEEDSVPNPAGADLWEDSTTEPEQVTFTWDEPAGDTSFLIGSSEKTDLQVSVTWQNDATNAWSTPLIVIGLILIVLGILLFISGTKAKKREKEREQARRERRRRLAQMGSAFAIVPGLALAGCGAPELPEPQPLETPTAPAASVTDEQLERVLEDIHTTIKEADDKLDTKKLGERADGSFHQQREGAYKIKKKDKKAKLPAAPAFDDVKVNFTSATDSWPRITSAVVSGNDQTQLVMLSQQDPRSPYRLWALTVLLPGAEFPEVEDARVGSGLLAADQDGLVMTPKQTVENYAEKLQKPNKAKRKGDFEDDAFAKQELETYKKIKKEIEKGNGSAKVEYSPGKQIAAQSTTDGSAIVIGSAVQTLSLSPETREGQTGELTVPNPQAKVVGESKTQRTLQTEYTQVYAFVVPKKGEGKVRLIGVSTAMSDAKLSGNN